jgi:hypothetical protein
LRGAWRHDVEVLRILYDVFDDLGDLESHVIDNTMLDEHQTVTAIQTKVSSGELLI